ncbi:MAG TPA: hypothetical protein VJ914_01770 [Pseudonocardiaceae bacterium]|nr:hypothetical protein [Pseudonocardiaceae bacterium]
MTGPQYPQYPQQPPQQWPGQQPGYQQPGPPQQGPPRQGPPQQGPAQQGPPQQGPAQQGPAQQGPARQGPPRQGPPQPGYQQPHPGQPPYQPHQQPGYQPSYQPGYQPGFPQQPQPKSRKGLVIILVAALIVVVGGGLGLYFGLSGGKPGPVNQPGPTANALGDVATIDPCSVISLNTFKGQAAAANGNVTTPVAIVPYSFSGCEADILTTASQDIIVDISDAENFAARLVKPETVNTTTSGTWHVVAPKDTSDTTKCREWTYQDKNGFSFQITASPGDDSNATGPAPDGPTLCNLAHLTTTTIATAMQNGTFKHLDYGTGSLASVVGCSLLTPAQVGSVLGNTAPMHEDKASSGHECTWDTPNSPTAVPYAYFVPYVETSQPDTTNSKLDYVGNRASLLTPIQQQSGDVLVGCSIQTPAKQWTKWPGTIVTPNPGTLYEYATITAYVTGSDPNQACDAAKQLAQTAWPKLPAYKP